MKILVANLGSTSFKFQLFDMVHETMLAKGGVERIGAAQSRCHATVNGVKVESQAQMADHAVAVEWCLETLVSPPHGCLQSAAEVAGIGFKAVHGGRISGVQRITPDVLQAMEEMNAVAPAHNPPYIAAMRQLQARLPHVPLVAAFETDFHASIPAAGRTYPVPWEWAEQYQIRKWGFHGASHRYMAGRMATLLGNPQARVVSCHLGGSNSLCAIRNGQSIATTMGMSPQTGLCHNNRVGDFDPFALPLLIERTGKSLEELLEVLAEQSGLLGLSGLSGDVRDLETAATQGNERATLALDTFVHGIRQHLGSMLVHLGGAEAIVFTGGIGENSVWVRQQVTQGLDDLGIVVDSAKNATLRGEGHFHAEQSRTQLWVAPTNEELIVARQTRQLLES